MAPAQHFKVACSLIAAQFMFVSSSAFAQSVLTPPISTQTVSTTSSEMVLTTASTPSSGSNPFAITPHGTKIKTCSDFLHMRDDLTDRYVLMNDINCNGQSIKPFGDANHPFLGKLFGQGHKITNATFVIDNTLDSSMFPGNEGRVRDINFENIKFSMSSSKFKEKKNDAGLNIQDSYGAAVETDGKTLIVGAPLDPASGKNSGTVTIFEKNKNVWKKVDKFTSLVPKSDSYFGSWISLWGDRFIIPKGDVKGLHGVYVFRKINNQWLQETELDALGNDVAAIYGSYIAISVPAYVEPGKVLVYHYDGSNWVLQDTLTMPTDISSYKSYSFGETVDIGPGMIVVGAPSLSNTSVQGKVFIYRLSINGHWELQQTIEGPTRGFGKALSVDRTSVAVGDWAGVYTFDVTGKTSSALTTLATLDERVLMHVMGSAVKIHNGVIAVSTYPVTVPLGAKPSKEIVMLFKKMEDNKWYKIGEFSPSDFMPTASGTTVRTCGYGRAFDFTNTDIFVGAPYGDPVGARVNKGSVYAYSAQDTLTN